MAAGNTARTVGRHTLGERSVPHISFTRGVSAASRRGTLAFLVLVLLPGGLLAETRYSAGLAGAWYPAGPEALRTQIEGFLKGVPPGPLAGQPVAFVAPHAGYTYSGETAAHVYALLRDARPQRVILLGPSHRQLLKGAVVIPDGVFSTPLGGVPVDEDLATRLIGLAGPEVLRSDPRPFAGEHSIEIHLPFLQIALGEAFAVVPILVPNDDLKVASALADALARLRAEIAFVVVASTDLSHFHPLSRCREIDDATLRLVKLGRFAELFEKGHDGACEACGLGALVATGLYAAREKADRGLVLRHDTSATATYDASRVVGYGAVAFTRAEGVGSALSLSPEERLCLLEIADRAVRGLEPDGKGLSARLKEPARVFVTLKRGVHLRGCIGDLSGGRPLFEAVAWAARQAAYKDPRFLPVHSQELPEINYECSVLTPFEKVKAGDEIRVGRDGLLIEGHGRSGLLLPQVPVEWSWGLDEFLAETCQKAGLPAGCTADPEVTLYRFSAEVF